MELRARFDEQNNLNYTDILYEAGCKIIYGFSNYKVHSKLCLITIKNKNNIEYITQVGTGNYNEVTAKIYSDFSLITANQEIGQDANLFFKNMAMNNYNPTYKHLFAAPTSLKSSFLSLIDKEIAKKEQGYILFKMNSLTDRDFIDKLAEASRSGVSVKLIIRGICCILPGIENATENIEVKSIVGRFLEHARIYCFGRDDDMKMYLSSADLMTRNTERRIEIAAPVYDEKIKKEIIDYLNMQGQDNIKARIMDINGQYHKITLNDNDPLSSQKYYLYKYYDKVVDQKPDTQLDVLKRFFKNLFSNN